MSQIASFYLLKDGRRQELSNGDCSGAVYMAIWDWCESELDLDVRFPAPQTEDTLDCALLEGELASNVLAALREQDLPVWGNFSGQLREVLLPQSCQQLRRQLSLQQSAVQGVFRLGSRKTDIQIQFALTPVPDGHIDRAGAVTVGQLLPLVIFYQIKGRDL